MTIYDTTKIVDLAVASIFNYQLDSSSSPLVNAKPIVNARTIVNAKSIVNGTAFVSAKNIVNGTTVLNSTSVGDTSNSNVVVIIDEDDVPAQTNSLTEFKAINLVTGITSGQFSIVPGAFLSDNFEITYGLGHMTIRPVKLNVKADNKVIFQGDVLPPFSSTITGFKNGDSALSGPTYTLSPVYAGQAGTYSIVPANLGLESPENYVVTYQAGTLYVDPKGANAKNIKPSLLCIEVLKNDPSGFKYKANFAYKNENPTVVYVPIGENNSLISAGSYSGSQPELFVPGGGQFSILFDGLKLIWTVKTFSVFQKTAISTEATSTSGRCNNKLTIQTSSAISASSTELAQIKTQARPNPVKDWVTISVDKGLISEKDVVVLSTLGVAAAPNHIRKTSNRSLELDLSNLAPGMYLINAKVGNEYKLFKVVKL